MLRVKLFPSENVQERFTVTKPRVITKGGKSWIDLPFNT